MIYQPVGGLMILIIAVLNWEILGNALRDDSKLFHFLTQKEQKLLANRLVWE